ncbi:MAG: AAA family ATPase [Enterocloster clostridioformis]|uniref:AAA family ATPase n=1 Tax=Enterocloster clostridioformis TaxID=1531 RepID=UPI0029016530|nr:AAA family ATPase [Enterocloster clostridioformis]MDU1961665.1 AAA family ATPase [Enterocloster clostridioformis]
MAVGKKIFEPDEIRKTIQALKDSGELFEVRCLESNGKRVSSGYFRDTEMMLEQLSKLSTSDSNIYIMLNNIKPECYSREQRDKFITNAKVQTSDNDICGYEWLFIDVDPKRPAGVSSTDEQLRQAKGVGNKVYAFMKNLGFNNPITAMSGNGIHLLYKIRLRNSEENKTLIKNCLLALDMLFSDEFVDIDKTNFNPARICKLYGTMARKGSNTPENPHRMSHLLSEGSREPTDRAYLEKLSAMLPVPEKPQKYNGYSPREFDLEEWLIKYGLRYQKTSYSNGTKYILEQCPFDSNHKGKDACIFQARSGAIGFHCFHNSCQDKTWRDVRMLFEPDAYEKCQQDYERRIYSRQPVQQAKVIWPIDGKPVFYTAQDVLNLPVPEERFIKTGIADIDKKLRGMKKGYVSVMSGLRAAGKSSVISEMVLDGVESGNNIGVFSGELAPKNFMRWMNLQAAGKGYTEPTQFEGYYNVQRKYQEQIAQWLGEHFWLYNNEYGFDFQAVVDQFKRKIEKDKLDMLILDNLMTFDISGMSENKFEAQTKFILALQGEIAKPYNVHIMFVAHPRKAMGFLRLDDISGTADLGNAVDNAFIVHRVNQDFKRLSKQMFGWKDDNQIYQATNVIEIAKDRDGGVMDYFIPLYYEPETKRLKNYSSENKIYGWNKTDNGFIAVHGEIPFD